MIFPANSRYQGVATRIWTSPDGVEIAYLAPRIVPLPGRATVLSEYVVAEGDRLDTIAAVAIGDPELSWRIADANRALDPFDLTDPPGRRLHITLPDAVGGLPRA
jgi:hypothetical protein